MTNATDFLTLGVGRGTVMGTSGGGGAFSPSDIAGLQLWLKADSLSLNDGDPVSTWADQSGNSRDASQATSSKQPTYKTNILNSKPVVRFDGTDDFMTISAFQMFPSMRGTVFIVVDERSTAGTNTVLATYTAGSPAWQYFIRSVATRFKWYDGTATRQRTTGDPDFFFIQTMRRSSDTSMEVYDTLDLSETLTIAGNQPNSATTAVGANTIGTENLNGDVAEIIVYDTSLSATDRTNVYNYLSDKYAITYKVIDCFGRADSNSDLGTSNTGHAWTAVAGSWGIDTNRAKPVSPSGYTQATVDSGLADCTVQVTLQTVQSGGYSGLIFRSTNSSNYLYVEGAQGTNYTLYKVEGGSFTSLGTYSTGPSSGDIVKVVLSGSSIEVFINGTSRITATNSFNSTATKHGIGTYFSADSRFDDFTVKT